MSDSNECQHLDVASIVGSLNERDIYWHCLECKCIFGKAWHKREFKTPSFDTTEMQTFGPLAKPSNPKDIIGARKVPLSTVPAAVMMEIGLAMLEGACKYGRHNFRAVGVRASVYYDAAMGHMMDWWEGDDIDIDSNLSHVTKALATLTVLRDAMLQDKLTDDRPPRSKTYKRDMNVTAAAIIDKHSDKSPRHYTIEDTP